MIHGVYVVYLDGKPRNMPKSAYASKGTASTAISHKCRRLARAYPYDTRKEVIAEFKTRFTVVEYAPKTEGGVLIE